MFQNVYFEVENQLIYLHLDNQLRLIPSKQTFHNLFDVEFDPSLVQQFQSDSNPPFPIGYPILDGSKLYSLPGAEGTYFFADVLPWNQNTPALRPIVNKTQLQELGFAPHATPWPASSPYDIGVPLAIHTNQNWHLQTFICGYHIVYNHLCHPENPINPFFAKWLDNNFSQAEVKARIASTQAQIDALKGVVPVQMPTFSPAPGIYPNATLDVTLSCPTAGATIYYTTDGTLPIAGSSPVYTAPISLPLGTTETSSFVLSAIAENADSLGTSDVVTAKYSYSGGAEAPMIQPPDGKQPESTISVKLTCPTPGAFIYYTTDGTSPTLKSTRYSSPFTLDLSSSEQQVQAVASVNGVGTLSPVATANYHWVPAKLAPPVFSPTTINRIGPSVTVTLTAQAAAKIRYGGIYEINPTPHYSYTMPFFVSLAKSGYTSVTLVADAQSDSGAEPSEVSTQTYNGTFPWNCAWSMVDDTIDFIGEVKLNRANVEFHTGNSGNSATFSATSILDTRNVSGMQSAVFSVACWAKVSSVDSTSGYSPLWVFEQESTGNDGPGIFVYSDGSVKGETVKGDGTYVEIKTASNQISFQNWNHYVLVADMKQLTLYINGVSVGSAACDGTIMTARCERLCIGAERAGTPNDSIRHGLTGFINRFYYSSSALTPEQVAALYQEEPGANI